MSDESVPRPTYKKRTMFRGDTLEWDLDPVMDQKLSVPFNLTGAVLRLTVKNNYVDPDNLAVLSVASDQPTGLASVIITDAIRGLSSVTINPLATRAFADGVTRCVYDVQMKDSQGRIRTIESGTLHVYPDVGRTIY